MAKIKFIVPILLILFSGCSIKEYAHTKSKIITIKTDKLKYSDLGYVKNSDDAVSLELFVAGKMIQNIEINYLICVDEGCMSKSSFNEEYLNASYPDELLQNISLGKPIYNRKNFVKTNDGFEQYIRDDNVNIKYSVDSKEIRFKDRRNSILFKIKELR
ncbi:MAG: hypothetical protein U9N39_02150 [Campylobacterota bacterium]|nr:hypothetical protein [Campylobacterota bacterium]